MFILYCVSAEVVNQAKDTQIAIMKYVVDKNQGTLID
jgi:hypothetical protein